MAVGREYVHPGTLPGRQAARLDYTRVQRRAGRRQQARQQWAAPGTRAMAPPQTQRLREVVAGAELEGEQPASSSVGALSRGRHGMQRVPFKHCAAARASRPPLRMPTPAWASCSPAARHRSRHGALWLVGVLWGRPWPGPDTWWIRVHAVDAQNRNGGQSGAQTQLPRLLRSQGATRLEGSRGVQARCQLPVKCHTHASLYYAGLHRKLPC